MLNNISYFKILGLPVIVWMGILTLTCLLFTAMITTVLKQKIPFKLHPIMARITIALALIHAILGVLAYF